MYLIKSSVGNIIIKTDLPCNLNSYFVYTFIASKTSETIFLKVYHTQSLQFSLERKNDVIFISDDRTNGLPKYFIIYLSHIIYEKNISEGDLILHGGAITNSGGNSQIILGYPGAGKTSVIMNSVLKNNTNKCLANTRSIISNKNGEREIVMGTKIVSIRKNALSFYTHKTQTFIKKSLIREENDRIYIDLGKRFSDVPQKIGGIFVIKFSEQNIGNELTDIHQKVLLLIQSLYQTFTPVVLPNGLFISKALHTYGELIGQKIFDGAKTIPVHTVEGSLDFILHYLDENK